MPRVSTTTTPAIETETLPLPTMAVVLPVAKKAAKKAPKVEVPVAADHIDPPAPITAAELPAGHVFRVVRAADLVVVSSPEGRDGDLYEPPRASDAETAALEMDVRAKGVRKTVTAIERDGRLLVLDGRRRTAAAQAVGPDTAVPVIVVPDTGTAVEKALDAMTDNSTSVAPNAAELARVLAQGVEAQIAEERLLVAAGGKASRLRALTTIASRGSRRVLGWLGDGTITETGALRIIEGTPDTFTQDRALDVLQKAIDEVLDNGSGRGSPVTGSRKADVSIDPDTGATSVTVSACEAAAVAACEAVGAENKRMKMTKAKAAPKAAPVEAPAPAAPVVTEAPAAKAEPAAPAAKTPAAPQQGTALAIAKAALARGRTVPTATLSAEGRAYHRGLMAALAMIVEGERVPGTKPNGELFAAVFGPAL